MKASLCHEIGWVVIVEVERGRELLVKKPAFLFTFQVLAIGRTLELRKRKLAVGRLAQETSSGRKDTSGLNIVIAVTSADFQYIKQINPQLHY